MDGGILIQSVPVHCLTPIDKQSVLLGWLKIFARNKQAPYECSASHKLLKTRPLCVFGNPSIESPYEHNVQVQVQVLVHMPGKSVTPSSSHISPTISHPSWIEIHTISDRGLIVR